MQVIMSGSIYFPTSYAREEMDRARVSGACSLLTRVLLLLHSNAFLFVLSAVEWNPAVIIAWLSDSSTIVVDNMEVMEKKLLT